jgi:tetratricopeptide (TPR) repeat protein
VQGGRSAALVLGLLVCCAGSAQAGLYSRIEPYDRGLNRDFRLFRETLISLWNLNNPNAAVTRDSVRWRYLQLQEQMKRGLPEDLSSGERQDLGAALIRLGKYEEAIQVLRPGAALDRDNFLLLANLATAYHLAGQGTQALDAVQSALAVWPEDWAKLDMKHQVLYPLEMGWDAKQLTWHRRAETYFRQLLRLRLRESLKQRNQPGLPTEGLDDLFGVRFVGESGKYEAGTLAREQRKKVPEDGIKIVQQLLVWLPADMRLYWLLGELYNAQGDNRTALEIFNALITKGGGPPELRAHRRILEAQPTATPNRSSPGLGETSISPATPKKDQQPADNSAGSSNLWQTFGVGFLAGALVALLGLWQVRELRRRRGSRREQ